MNDETRELQHRLERATAAECLPQESLEPETASLREGWLALGQLIETAQPALDRPLPLRRAGPKKTLRWRKAVAMAASLAIGVALAWGLTAKYAADPTQPAREMAAASGVSEKNVIAQVDPIAELEWDDSLDDQIAMVGWEIIQVQGDRYCLDDAFRPLWESIDRMEQEIENSTL